MNIQLENSRHELGYYLSVVLTTRSKPRLHGEHFLNDLDRQRSETRFKEEFEHAWNALIDNLPYGEKSWGGGEVWRSSDEIRVRTNPDETPGAFTTVANLYGAIQEKIEDGDWSFRFRAQTYELRFHVPLQEDE